jgi:1,2-diacylglycerol 3-alpha-glucosyltransferase
LKVPVNSTAAIVWAQYGPYHFARLKAAQAFAKNWRYLGVEIASRTTTYAWDRKSRNETLHTLCPGESAESAGFFKVFFRAFRFFRSHNVKVVFVPSYWPAASLGVMLAAKFSGARLVMMNESHRHTAQAKGIRLWIKRRLISLFDAALVGGRPQRDYFTDLGMAADSIFDGYDVVDNDFFSRRAEKIRNQESEIREQYALPEAYFLSIGRMEDKKNLPLLLEAYARSRINNPATPRLVFVGSGTGEQPLKNQCRELGLSFADLNGLPAENREDPVMADVLFYGFRQADELPVFYSFARVFILPSKKEEWGLVVNEAMACGLPVIVSQTAGCAPDLVQEGVNGFTFDPGNVEQLADLMFQISAFPPFKLSEFGHSSRKIISKWGVLRFAENAERAANFALLANL